MHAGYRHEAAATTDIQQAVDMTDFSDLPLAEPLQRAVAGMGYTQTTPIQAQAIPVVLAGQDVMGAAQTGTGKTAAFALPLLQRLMRHENHSASPARHPVRALVLLPTRELADQVAQQIRQYAQYTHLRSAVVFGGMDMKPQTAELKAGIEVLVATPGRLLDHIEARNCVLNQVEYVVLDEADRMLDIGFLPDLERILAYLPKQRTTLLFSATFSPEIKRLASSYLHNPITIEVARSNETASTVTQRFVRVEDADKRAALEQLIRDNAVRQAFVFTNSKLGCSRLARALERDGFRTAALHGDKSQDERLKSLDAFKAGDVDYLICTDVAARGLDIKDVPAVFNYDIPFNAEDYVHRIGRTGRAGAEGLAISLVGDADARLVAEIGKLTHQTIHPESLALASRSASHRHLPERGHEGRSEFSRRSSSHARSEDDRGRDRDPQGDRYRRAPKVTDAFFDRPYEPQKREEAPTWEAAAPRKPMRSSLSANIRPRRPMAALFKAPQPASAPVADPAAGSISSASSRSTS